jgi:hypothetical protein
MTVLKQFYSSLREEELDNLVQSSIDVQTMLHELRDEHETFLHHIQTDNWIKKHVKRYSTLENTCELLFCKNTLFLERFTELTAQLDEEAQNASVQLLEVLYSFYRTFASVNDVRLLLKLTILQMSTRNISTLSRIWCIVLTRNPISSSSMQLLLKQIILTWMVHQLVAVPHETKCDLLDILQVLLTRYTLQKSERASIKQNNSNLLEQILDTENVTDVTIQLRLLSFITSTASILHNKLVSNGIKLSFKLLQSNKPSSFDTIWNLFEYCLDIPQYKQELVFEAQKLIDFPFSTSSRKLFNKLLRALTDRHLIMFSSAYLLIRAVKRLAKQNDEKILLTLWKCKNFLKSGQSVEHEETVARIVSCMISNSGEKVTSFTSSCTKLCSEILQLVPIDYLLEMAILQNFISTLAARAWWSGTGRECTSLLFKIVNDLLHRHIDFSRTELLKYTFISIRRMTASSSEESPVDYSALLYLFGVQVNLFTGLVVFESRESLEEMFYVNYQAIPFVEFNDQEWENMFEALMSVCLLFHEPYMSKRSHQILEHIHVLCITVMEILVHMHSNRHIETTLQDEDTQVPFIPTIVLSMIFERQVAVQVENLLYFLIEHRTPRVKYEMELAGMLFKPVIKTISSLPVPLSRVLCNTVAAKQLVNHSDTTPQIVEQLLKLLDNEKIWYGTRARFSRFIAKGSASLPRLFS